MKKSNSISVIVFLFVSIFTLHATDFVFISEIMYDSPLNEVITQPPYSNGEYVELYNAGYYPVDLSGWQLKGEGVTETYVFGEVTMQPKSFLIVAYRHSQSSDFELDDLYTGISPSVNDGIIYQNKVVLSNTKEYIKLKDSGGLLRDSIYYGNVTSIQPISARLVATNASGISGFDCVSVHQGSPVFDENGCVIPNYLHWQVSDVTPFGLPAAYVEPEVSSIEYDNLSGQNYIISSVPKTAKTSMLPGSKDALTTIQYFDGLGRPTQTVQMEVTPGGADLVSLTQYDGVGREWKNWLPTPTEGNFGQYVDESSFMSNASTKYNDTYPYSEIKYEPSPLNRVEEQYGPGASWHNNNKRVTTDYEANDGSIAYFYVNESGNLQRGSNYAAVTLYKTTVADEDGKATCEYKDKLGQVVLKQSFDDGDEVNTYYVYTDLGQLSYVIPPIAVDSLPTATGQINDDNGVLKRYAYLYKYDERGNCIEKRLPGCDPIYIVYDKANRLILSQDGNQRKKDQWMVNKYDVLGRVLYTGYLTSEGSTRQQYKANLDSFIVTESYAGSSGFAGTGYTCNTNYFPETITPLTVNYYDNHNFVTDLGLTNLAYIENTDYGSKYNNHKSLLTGTRTYLLDGSGNYTTAAMYYDYKGQVVQSRSTNYLGGYDFVYNQYNFTGNVTKKLMEHNIAGQSTVTELYEYAFDHALRQKTTNYRLNNNTPVVLASNDYDEFGRMETEYRHNSTDTINVKYNLRGWTTKIKSGTFEQNLYYNANINNPFATNCYNGNIAFSTWTYNGATKAYVYDYDDLNRLTEAIAYQTNGYTLFAPNNKEKFEYDKQGNIERLWRQTDYEISDFLHIYYYGNQVKSILDDGGSQGQYSVKEYQNMASLPVEFAYDKNGNMTKDLDRDIVTIRYNLLNLPDTIQFRNGNQILNTYDAGGRKLRTLYVTNLKSTINPIDTGAIYHWTYDPTEIYYNGTAYIDNFEYTVNKEYVYEYGGHYIDKFELQRIHNVEGYVDDLTNPDHAERYNYYRRDHLGNNREVWKASRYNYTGLEAAQTVQRTQYYPSGLPWAYNTLDNLTEQPYRYNGKEFVEMHGLESYDYGARGMYPAIGRFTTVDPLAEDYYDVSPYVYGLNNPMRYNDPTGMAANDTITIDKDIPEVTVTASSQFINVVAMALYSFSWYGKQINNIFGNTNASFSDNFMMSLTFWSIVYSPLKTKSISTRTVKGPKIGQRFGKLGVVIKKPKIQVTSYGKHGTIQATMRGVTNNTINNTVNNAKVVLKQSSGNYLFITEDAAVVLNQQGRVVTTYPAAKFDQEIINVLNTLK